ncbi:MAG TPA: GNAT family N-acetyltransferase [Myxococcaceae bacterium]|nr:GNAT family N-acetyltransferase [Myxococcaceae bacterium]
MSTPLPAQLRVHSAISEVPRDAWNALLDEESIPFLEWQWLEALEESGSVSPRTGWHPRHLTLWRGSRLVAAAPAYLKDHSHGEFVFDWSWASAAERIGLRYYPKLILAVPMTPATSARILVGQGEDRAARTEELLTGALEYARSEELSSVHVLFQTPQECEPLEAAGFCLRFGVQYHWLNEGYTSFDGYLARFNSKRRNQLRREQRAPSEQGIAIRTIRGDELTGADPDEVYRLYCTTVDKQVWGHRNLNASFFRRILKTFRDRVELVEARRDGRLLAGAFNLASPRVLYGRYWGCFEEHPFLHFNVCLYHSIEECIRRGTARFEPGAGGEHKLVRGFEPRLTYSAHWIFHPVLDKAVRSFLTHERAAIEKGLPDWRAETGFKSH